MDSVELAVRSSTVSIRAWSISVMGMPPSRSMLDERVTAERRKRVTLADTDATALLDRCERGLGLMGARDSRARSTGCGAQSLMR